MTAQFKNLKLTGRQLMTLEAALKNFENSLKAEYEQYQDGYVVLNPKLKEIKDINTKIVGLINQFNFGR